MVGINDLIKLEIVSLLNMCQLTGMCNSGAH